ncbi:MAG TPA: ABC transporter substrate-binding protein [Stellaceae bacterium]|jgi:ABC-type nitrate/sulfonate/bicarbonate transport system substrate-binding protein
MQKNLCLTFAAFVATLVAATGIARAADTIRVGTPEPHAFNFGMLDAGTTLGIFAKNGIEVQRLDLGGGAKLHQAMVATAIDAALGGGTDVQFLVKGSPEKAIAVFGTAPANLAIIVAPKSPIKTLADLEGKKIGISTVGSLTNWFALEVARRQGWGPDGIVPVPVGSMESGLAALAAGNIDADSGNLEVSYIVEAQGKLRILARGGDLVKDFVASVIYASDAEIAEHPDVLRRFLKGWFETVAYLHAHKAEAIPIMAKIMNASPAVTAKIYDAEMDSFPTDGHFDRAKLRIVEEALLNFHLIPEMPDNSKLLNESFLPPR